MNNEMGITISGGKLPITVLAIGLAGIFTSIMYATIWLTKLDNRVFDNATAISQLQQMSQKYADTLDHVQSNCQKQTFVLDALVKKVNKEHP